MTEEDWKRLADAYRDYVPPAPLVDTGPEFAKRRDAAREALASMRLAGGEPTAAFLALTERWIVGELDEEQVIEEIKRLPASATSS